FVRPGPDMRQAEAKAVESYGGRQHEQQPQRRRPAARRARFECHDRTRRAISSMIFVPWNRPFSMKIVPVSTPAIAPPATNSPGTSVSKVSASQVGPSRAVSVTPARRMRSVSARYPVSRNTASAGSSSGVDSRAEAVLTRHLDHVWMIVVPDGKNDEPRVAGAARSVSRPRFEGEEVRTFRSNRQHGLVETDLQIERVDHLPVVLERFDACRLLVRR